MGYKVDGGGIPRVQRGYVIPGYSPRPIPVLNIGIRCRRCSCGNVAHPRGDGINDLDGVESEVTGIFNGNVKCHIGRFCPRVRKSGLLYIYVWYKLVITEVEGGILSGADGDLLAERGAICPAALQRFLD